MPGTYLLQVVLMDAWNEALGAGGECVLLKQIVRVDGPDEGFNTAYVILGCASGAAILIIMLLFVTRKYKDRFEHIFGTIIVEVFKLTFAWAFEGGDIATDGINFHRTVISNEIRVGYILPQRYKIAYIVIMCLASAAAAVSFVNRVRQTRDLLRSIRERLSKSASASKPDEAYNVEAKVDQLNWEVVKFKRDILGIAVSALTVLCEGRAHASLKMDALPSALSSLAPLHGVCVGMMAPKGTVWVRPRIRVAIHAVLGPNTPLPFQISLSSADIPFIVLNCCLIFSEAITDQLVRFLPLPCSRGSQCARFRRQLGFGWRGRR